MRPVAHGSKRTQDLCCWADCFQLVEHPDVPLCEGHLGEVGLRWLNDNIDLVRAVCGTFTDDERYLSDAKRRVAINRPEIEARWAAERAEREVGAVVYYLRIGDRIKIGFTTNLKQRVANLRLDFDAVLATEPGGRDQESRRHQQFADERYGRREDFAPSDRLMVHIASLQ